MSTPASGSFFFQDDTDLVEDAFLSSPVSTAADRIEASWKMEGQGAPEPLLWQHVNQEPASPLQTCFPSETYSRKVFIGGLPQDVAEEDIWTFFLRFGPLTVDWPHKTHTRGSIPPKGYAFLLFRDELSVHSVLKSCVCEGDKFFLHIPTLSVGRKKVFVSPNFWVASSFAQRSRKEITVVVSFRCKALDQRRAVFVGGVPRPLKALELAQVMNEKYGNVSFVAIDCDSELKYPKGAACVVFTSHSSYIAAVSARFMQLSYGDMEKKIEIKPYVLDGQLCDECHGVQSDRKPAPFFCGSMTCLKYYCEHCWATVHSMPNWQNHRPLLKDVGDHHSSSERLLNEMLNRSERSRLGAALDYCWFDHPGRSGLSQDERSVSSGSRTPSPFGVASASSSNSSSVPSSHTPTHEMYSRKVFVGGLPPDIDQGYAFLLFREEASVQRLVKSCVSEDGKLYVFVSSVTQINKKVQIRPWKITDSDFIMDHSQPIDPRKTIFIGGVPRPLKAHELADIFNSRYGNVCYAGIDVDPELKYPKGAGRVTFSSRVSFMSAVSCRFFQVEVKPYVLDDQMCDECHGVQCGGRLAPYFCGNIHCLRYYCEHCWASVHSAPGTQTHRCFVKENGDRPRAINFYPSHQTRNSAMS
eukprot:Em0013g172a